MWRRWRGWRRKQQQPHLQEFDALSQCSGVQTGPAACGIDVTLHGVVQLATGLVKGAQVHPGGGVVMIKLNGADVGLKSVHRLVLLLVEHAAGKNSTDPSESHLYASRIS